MYIKQNSERIIYRKLHELLQKTKKNYIQKGYTKKEKLLWKGDQILIYIHVYIYTLSIIILEGGGVSSSFLFKYFKEQGRVFGEDRNRVIRIKYGLFKIGGLKSSHPLPQKKEEEKKISINRKTSPPLRKRLQAVMIFWMPLVWPVGVSHFCILGFSLDGEWTLVHESSDCNPFSYYFMFEKQLTFIH